MFSTIYYWVSGLYSQYLDFYLLGYDGSNYTLPILYDQIGSVTLGISLGIMLIYYYVLNLTRFSSWWSWVIILLINSSINLIHAYSWTLNHLNSGKIPQALVSSTNANGDPIPQITEASCLGFGFANAIVSAGFFILFSFGLRWWSRNCRYTPCKIINKKFYIS